MLAQIFKNLTALKSVEVYSSYKTILAALQATSSERNVGKGKTGRKQIAVLGVLPSALGAGAERRCYTDWRQPTTLSKPSQFASSETCSTTTSGIQSQLPIDSQTFLKTVDMLAGCLSTAVANNPSILPWMH